MIGDEVTRWLQINNFGTEATNLFLGFQPDMPDNCITIYDTSAVVSDDSHAINTDQVGIQILVRNNNYLEARNISQNIYKKLLGFGGSSLYEGGTLVHAVYLTTAPTSIGKDDNGRNEWSTQYMFRIDSQGNDYR